MALEMAQALGPEIGHFDWLSGFWSVTPNKDASERASLCRHCILQPEAPSIRGPRVDFKLVVHYANYYVREFNQ